MRLIIELSNVACAIVNIHDVVLATEFLPELLAYAGEVVFDGPSKM